MPSKKSWANGIRMVISNKRYLYLFTISSVFFAVALIFSWNMILLANMFVRADLWTFKNILLLLSISILSGLAISLSAFSYKANITYHQKRYGYFAAVPALFATACPTCAPLLLSLSSTTFAIGMAISKYNTPIRLILLLILSFTVVYMSSTIGNCKIKK